MKIIFRDRSIFERAVPIVLHYNTRQDSAADIDIGYADMIFSFDDIYHFNRAVYRLKAESITEFEIVS